MVNRDIYPIGQQDFKVLKERSYHKQPHKLELRKLNNSKKI